MARLPWCAAERHRCSTSPAAFVLDIASRRPSRSWGGTLTMIGRQGSSSNLQIDWPRSPLRRWRSPLRRNRPSPGGAPCDGTGGPPCGGDLQPAAAVVEPLAAEQAEPPAVVAEPPAAEQAEPFAAEQAEPLAVAAEPPAALSEPLRRNRRSPLRRRRSPLHFRWQGCEWRWQIPCCGTGGAPCRGGGAP